MSEMMSKLILSFPEYFVLDGNSLEELSEKLNKLIGEKQVVFVEYTGIYYKALVFGYRDDSPIQEINE